MNDEFNLVETKTSSNPMKWFFFQPEKSFNKLTLIKMMCIGIYTQSIEVDTNLGKLWCVTFQFLFSFQHCIDCIIEKNPLGGCLLCIQIVYQYSNAWLSNTHLLYIVYCISYFWIETYIFPFGYNREIMKMHRRKPFKFLL